MSIDLVCEQCQTDEGVAITTAGALCHECYDLTDPSDDGSADAAAETGDLDVPYEDWDECQQCGADAVMVAGLLDGGGWHVGSGTSWGGLCADCWHDTGLDGDDDDDMDGDD